MEVKTLIIVLLVFSAVIVGLNNFMADLSSSYGVSSEDISSLSNSDEISAQVTSIQETFDSKVTGTFLDLPISAISGGIEFLKLVELSLFGFWGTLLNGSALSEYLHLFQARLRPLQSRCQPFRHRRQEQ